MENNEIVVVGTEYNALFDNIRELVESARTNPKIQTVFGQFINSENEE